MKLVAGVSLGPSNRNKTAKFILDGQEICAVRVGTDGSIQRFAELMREYDNCATVIGLGGMDRWLYTNRKRFTVWQADRLARIAYQTPVVDGSGVKDTLERRTIEILAKNKVVDFKDSKVLLVSAVDRFGMAQELDIRAKHVIYGDIMFALGVDRPICSYSELCQTAALCLPTLTKLPIKWLYHSSNQTIQPQFGHYYEWADVIAGDWHYIRKYLPTPETCYLEGKTIITNTITSEDKILLAERGVATLITSTPEIDGRHFATNVIEGILLALLGKDKANHEEYRDIIKLLDLQPTIVSFT